MNVFHLAGALCMFSAVGTKDVSHATMPDFSKHPPTSGPRCSGPNCIPPLGPLDLGMGEEDAQDVGADSVIITLVVLGTGAVLAVIFAITVCVVKRRQGKRILKQDAKALEAGSKSKDESMSMPAEPAVEAIPAEAAAAPDAPPDAQVASPQSKSHSSSKE